MFALLVVFQTACLDTIEIDVPTIFENGLVIQGGLIRHGNEARVIVQFRSISDEKSLSGFKMLLSIMIWDRQKNSFWM